MQTFFHIRMAAVTRDAAPFQASITTSGTKEWDIGQPSPKCCSTESQWLHKNVFPCILGIIFQACRLPCARAKKRGHLNESSADREFYGF
jgi:hypothetical protein